MVISNIGTAIKYTVSGTGSTVTLEGRLEDKKFISLTPPGVAPFEVWLDGSIDLKGIAQSEVVITRYLADGWKAVISVPER